MDFSHWLQHLGLSEYAARFAENRIDFSVLRELTDADLEKLGLVLGDRRRLLRAIRDLDRAPEAERRQLTVMFCDLVGSTALSSRLDPEDLRTVVRAYHACCAGIIERHGGFVAQYLGDGVLAYFGYPRATEHDAEQAARAGLAIVAEVPQLPTAAAEPLRVRVGVATGLVVVGDLIGSADSRQRAVIGETPNLAARVQALAEPGTVAVADSTRRLLGSLFELHDLGEQSLKGIAIPMRVWTVVRESGVRALRAQGALIGRAAELDVLMRHWGRAQRSEGAAVLVTGEAGMGKSRLVAALLENAGNAVRYACSPHRGDSALYPFGNEVEAAADAGLSPQQRRQRTLQGLAARLESRARASPLLVIFEDAHWSDPTSLEVLGLLVERTAQLPLLLVVTLRTGFEVPWQGKANPMPLHRLPPAEAEAIVLRVAGGRPLPESARRQILERADGIPLFIEEITKAVLESETGAVPSSLHASLMARLDRLGPAREVAQMASAIGREFPGRLLATVAQQPVDAELARLVDAGLLLQHGERYVFSHALVQDAAYDTLLREPRRALHARIASAMEPAERPEIVARHFSAAGEAAKAAGLWARAGRASLAGSALVEAAEQLGRALAEIASLPGTPALRGEQARLQIELSNALIHTRGHAAPETQASFAQARAWIERTEALGEPLEDPLLLFSVLYGGWVASRMAFDGAVARELATQMLSLARGQRSPAPVMIGHMALGITLVLLGDSAAGRGHLDQAIALYDPPQHRALGTRFGHDVRVTALCWRGLALWFLGEPAAALADGERARLEARDIGHAGTLMFALSHTALLLHHAGRHAETGPLEDELIALAEAKGSGYWKSYGVLLQGWHRLVDHDAAGALPALESGASAMRATGATAYAPWYLAVTAQAHAALGREEDARSYVSEALATMERTKERWCEPLVRRVAATIGKGS